MPAKIAGSGIGMLGGGIGACIAFILNKGGCCKIKKYTSKNNKKPYSNSLKVIPLGLNPYFRTLIIMNTGNLPEMFQTE